MRKKMVTFLLICSSLIASDYDDAIGLYKQKHYKEASKLFTKSANSGDKESAYILGYLYTGGVGVEQDLKKSAFWYEKAAKLGHTNAQINLGWAYIGGMGRKVDYEKAAYWIKKAKQKGAKKAQMLWDEFKLYKYEDKK